MDTFQSIESGAGILKDQYPDQNKPLEEALRRRREKAYAKKTEGE